MSLLFKNVVMGLLSFFSALVLVGCSESADDSNDEDRNVSIVRPVATQTISTSSIDKLRFNGVVRSTERAELTFSVAGTLQRMEVAEGDVVKQGDILAQLEQEEFQITLDSAEVKYEKANADYNRALKIYQQTKAISESDLEGLKTEKELARNQLSNARKNLENSTLKAPFNGVVARELTNNFTNVQSNQTIFILHNPKNLELVIHVPSRLFLENSGSREALATVEGIADTELPVSFKYYSSDPDPLSQTYQVVLGFKDLKGKNILPGMSAKVNALTNADGQSAIQIPIDAVVPSNTGQQFVWLIDEGNRVRKQTIKVGRLYGDQVTVLNGLNHNDKIAVAGVQSLTEGMEVRALSDGGAH